MTLKFTGSIATTGQITANPQFTGVVAPAEITPTTWNSSISNSVVYSNSDLTMTVGSNEGRDSGETLISRSSGKYYCEFTLSNFGGSSSIYWGIGSTDLTGHTDNGEFWVGVGQGTLIIAVNTFNGVLIDNDGGAFWADVEPLDGSPPLPFGNSAIMQLAVDNDNGKLWFGADGTWFKVANQTDPENGLNSATTFTPTDIVMAAGTGGTNQPWAVTANFGATSFSHTVPTGFSEGFGEDA